MVQWHGDASVRLCCSVVVQWCSGAVLPWCSGAVVRWCSGAVVQWRRGALLHWRGGAVVPLRNGALVQWCVLMVAAFVLGWRVPIRCLILHAMLRAVLIRGCVSTFADIVLLWFVSFISGPFTWRAVSWVFPVTVLCNVRCVSIASSSAPEALYLYLFFVAV